MKKLVNYFVKNIVFIHQIISMAVYRLCILSLFILASPFILYVYKLLHSRYLFNGAYAVFESADFNFDIFFPFVKVILIFDMILLCIFLFSYCLTIVLLNCSNTVKETLLPSPNAAIEYSVVKARVKVISTLKYIKSVSKAFTACIFILSILPGLHVLSILLPGRSLSFNLIGSLIILFMYESFVPILFCLFITRCITKDISNQLDRHLNSTYNSEKKYNSLLGIKFDLLSGYDFEEYCAILLEKLNFEYVEVTAKSNDQGVDITAFYKGLKYAIQCKRYQDRVGNKAIQEVVAGKEMYNCQKALVITNSYFTKQAIELAKANGVILWDRKVLLRKISKASLIPDTKNDK